MACSGRTNFRIPTIKTKPIFPIFTGFSWNIFKDVGYLLNKVVPCRRDCLIVTLRAPTKIIVNSVLWMLPHRILGTRIPVSQPYGIILSLTNQTFRIRFSRITNAQCAFLTTWTSHNKNVFGTI
jgi:hypothetical protein